MSAADTKRRRNDVESYGSHVKTERGKAGITDKAKANYLSSQLRLRLQYAKLKVEHGWQRQTLSEVENLYFRHTHLTRPYPVISPGGRRNGRTLSSHGFLQQENVLSIARRELSLDAATQIVSATNVSAGDSFSSTLRPNSSGTLGGSSSSCSIETTATLSIPSTPTHTPTATATASRVATPLAPHVGAFGSTLTRYPIARSDSMATVIMESTPSLYQTHNPTPSAGASGRTPQSALAPSLSAPLQGAASQGASAFREPFDPMEPTEHLDSQLAALRSIISASAMPLALPAPPSAAPTAPPAVPAGNASYNEAGASSGGGGGLTYDSFWSAHGSATTSFRSTLGGQANSTRSGSVAHATAPLHPHAGAPAVLGPSGLMNANTNAYGGGPLG